MTELIRDNIIRATSIRYDGKNNYQSDFEGTEEKVIEDFRGEVKSVGARWAYLIDCSSGNIIVKYKDGVTLIKNSPLTN
jgi:hypothetical protein